MTTLRCLVEIPKGSRNKYEYDEQLGGIKLDRFLFSSVVFPADYGFIPDTIGEDGDALDAMVLVGERTFPGCLIEVRAIAVLRMTDDRGQDDKIVLRPARGPELEQARGPRATCSDQMREEIRHFCSICRTARGDRGRGPGLRGLTSGFDAHRGSAGTVQVAAIRTDQRQQLLAGREAAYVLLHALGQVAVHRRGSGSRRAA